MNQTSHLWRPFDKDYIANPYEMYRKLREEDPVHKSQTGEWIITRYVDAKNILRSNDFLVGNRFEWLKKGIDYFKDKSLEFDGIEQAMKGFILFLNAPDHTRVRRFIHAAWSDRDVEGIIKNNLEIILDGHRDHMDLVNDLGKPLPAMTISKILGLPEKDYVYLKELGTVMIKALDLYISLKDIKRINEASKAFLVYFKQIVDHKNRIPDDGLISKIIELNKKEQVLDEGELLSTCILLFIAGEETSISLMSTGMYNLISHDGVLQEVKTDFSKIPSAIEELIRFDAPVQIVGRIAGIDTTIHGKKISKNETLTICLGAANRDPEQFDRADELQIDRNPNKHLGFGGGAHYCMGDWLARIQTRLTIEALLSRYSTIKLKDSAPQWNNNLAIRSLSKLPVTLRN